MATRRGPEADGWILTPRAMPVATNRRAAAAEAGIPPEFLESEELHVETVYDATPEPGAMADRRGAAPPDLVLDVPVAPGENALLAIRHPSGAITFHPSAERVARSTRRGAADAEATAQFRVPVRRTGAEGGRRGVVTSTLKVVVVKVAKKVGDKLVSLALPKLAAMWETRTWRKKGIEEGWFKVASAPGEKPPLKLTKGTPPAGKRTLLLVHGTFSNAASAFGKLAGTDFFSRVRELYDDRVYAFNHFSVSRTPAENAAMLLDGLGPGEYLFDAITHSRGGLVLRNLVEHRQTLGSPNVRFGLGRAVLVASPNDGTPLATPTRWEQTVGWFANLMELFPDNPFTTGAEFVSESLVWLASHLAGDLPGLRSMDGAGDLVEELQSPPGPPAGTTYSALVSNFHPTGALWQRALDVGVDGFFGSANDLVVPSEGGWRVDRDGTPHIPGERIGCYGPGGNIGGAAGDPVHHVNFFARTETATFLATALAGRDHGLPPIDPEAPLPDRRFKRSGAGAGAAAATTAVASPDQPFAAPAVTPVFAGRDEDRDAFHIVVMEPQGDVAPVLAMYGGARVLSGMRIRAGEEKTPTLFGKIIRFHERVRDYTNGEGGSLPGPDEMIEFGAMLFETLFQGNVRRLYDEARARQQARKLEVVLTSMIPWIGEKPWEFCYDTSRKSFLATEEIHFVRNVLTAVPADPIVTARGPMRILVAWAQPVGFGALSVEEETRLVCRGFEPLRQAGLVTIDVLPRATPAALHGHLSTGDYEVVHFIGHGEFDEDNGEGCLVFENENGTETKLGERSVREIFCGRGLSLVFLNACETGTGSRADFNKGVAQALVAHGLPALVANQYSVLDASATSFAQHFYWSLAQGQTLGQAAREARIAVNYSLDGELIDWAIPVLYARDADQTLAPKSRAPLRVPATTVSAAGRRASGTHQLRVAVWDVDGAFPGLERTLDLMNQAQDVFGFELASMSAPLDAWQRTETTQTFRVEHVAKRLKTKTVELRVDLLVCLTRHPMQTEEGEPVERWTAPETVAPIAALSFARQADLPPAEPRTHGTVMRQVADAVDAFFA